MATKLVLVGKNFVDYKNVMRVVLPKISGSDKVFAQGDQIIIGDLVDDGRDLYQGELVTDIATQKPAIIINQGTYEDENGNRTGLVANPGKITYKQGEVVTVLVPDEGVPFEISVDAVTGTLAKDKYLIPQLGVTDTRLNVADNATGVAVAYKIETLSNVSVGRGFVQTAIVKTVLA